MAQVGKAYSYGAAGPNAYDCSGLTMRAWGMAGVGLPHSSGAQQGSGTRVSESELQPGDLVFYYSPVSHVGMYIGNGLIVNALNPGAGVRVSGLHSMPYSGAVRPG
jgi:cell wall-associated NlpC family hydrolase